MQIDIGYPDDAAERQIIIATTGAKEVEPEEVMNANDLMAAQAPVRQLPVGDSVIDAILKLVRAGRPESSEIPEVREWVAW